MSAASICRKMHWIALQKTFRQGVLVWQRDDDGGRIRRLGGLTVLATATAVASGSAWCGPPFVTDDPEPVGARRWEINVAFSQARAQGSVQAGLPSIDINYAPSPNVQLHIQPRYTIVRTSNRRMAGNGDTEIGVKYRFLNLGNDEAASMVGIYLMIQLPTANFPRDTDEIRARAFLPVWLQRNLGSWVVYGGAGHSINAGPR